MRPIDADRLMGDFLCTFYNDLDDQNRTEKLINEAPTVERPHGEWTFYKDHEFSGGGYIMCTKCKWKFSFGAYRILQDDNYCPHCGSDNRKRGD